MRTRSIMTCLSLVSALTAFAPTVSQAQDNNQIVEGILSQILGGGQSGEAYGGCRPIDRQFFDARLDRMTRRFYYRINSDINQGLMDQDEAFRYRRRVRFIHSQGEHYIADGCLTPAERSRLRREVHRLNDDLTNLEQNG